MAKNQQVLVPIADKPGKYRVDGGVVGRSIPATNEIAMFFHCGLCLKEVPGSGESPETYARLSVGFTVQGMQVWCVRHQCNVAHIDFENVMHAANTNRERTDGERKGWEAWKRWTASCGKALRS